MKRVPAKAPVSRHPEVVVARVLAAAQVEFMAVGYEAASTNRITKAFGGSKATLFRHFPTKEALLEGVIRAIASRWSVAVAAEAIPDGPPAEWLAAYARRTLDWILGEEPLFIGRLAIAEGHKFPSLQHVFAETAGGPLATALSERLAKWHRRGDLACSSPEGDATRFLDLTVSGLVSRALYRQPPLSAAERAEHVSRSVALFLDGCRARPADSSLPAARPKR
ncbi:MAG: hypothetical protein RJB26_2425 [Pseudomonadota bacterium]|jgi:AcrR family transcriptional regulator